MTRRRGLVLGAGMVGAAGALALAACGGPAAQAPAGDRTRPAKSVPVTVWARGATDKAVFDQITPLVEARHPHLNITVEAPAGIQQKLVVVLGSGDAPELATVNTPFFAPMVGKNAFYSLQPFLAKDRTADQELKHFAPPGLVAYRFRGELYAVPITSETAVFWYNEDLLRQANLTPPHEMENDAGRWSWNTVLEYARRLNRGRDQDRATFGLLINDNRQNGWGNLVYSNDGRVVTDDGTKMVMSQPPAAEAIQWAVDTIWRHDVAPQPVTVRATIDRQLFATGRLAMLMQGEFFRRYLFGPQSLGPAFKFNLAQMPYSPRTRKRANVYHALGLPIIRGTPRPEAAWEYLTVFMTEPAQQFITDGWGSRGGNQKTHEPWVRSNAGGGPPANWAAIVRSDAHGIPIAVSPYLEDAELFEATNRLMPLIYDNKLPVRQGLQQIDQETNAKLEPAVKAAGPRR